MRGQKSLRILAFVLLTLFTASQGSWADELSELKGHFEKLQKEMATLQERIGKLEAEKVMAKTDNWILGKKGDRIRIGGGVELEYSDGQDATWLPSTANEMRSTAADGHFQVDKFELKLDAKVTDGINFKSKVRFDGDDNDIEVRDTYLEMVDLPLDSYVQVGNNTVFFRPDRITEGYPLGGTAFWRKRGLGIWYGGQREPLYWRFSLTNGLELDDKDFGETSGTTEFQRIIGDDKRNDDLNGNKELGFGLGLKQDLQRFGEVDLLGFVTRGRLTGEDVTFLQTAANVPGYGSSSRTTKERYGINLDYTYGNANLFGQFIRAFDGKLRRNAWYLQPSYKHPLRFKYLKAIQPLFRYGQYTINMAHVPAEGLTWGRQQYTAALIGHVTDNFRWKWEYHFNREDTGSSDEPRNDEWVTQLDYSF